MSLVLIAHDANLGIVCSDGRVSRVEDDGRRIIVREDCRKFTVLAEKLVVAATGRADIADYVMDSVSRVLKQLTDSSGRFEKLAEALPVLAVHGFAEYPVKGPQVNLSVVLLGLDELARRVRCVSWVSREGFQPFEGTEKINLFAFGDTGAVDEAVAQLKQSLDAQPERTEGSLCSAMRSVVRQMAEAYDGINDTTFFHIVTRE